MWRAARCFLWFVWLSNPGIVRSAIFEHCRELHDHLVSLNETSKESYRTGGPEDTYDYYETVIFYGDYRFDGTHPIPETVTAVLKYSSEDRVNFVPSFYSIQSASGLCN